MSDTSSAMICYGDNTITLLYKERDIDVSRVRIYAVWINGIASTDYEQDIRCPNIDDCPLGVFIDFFVGYIFR